MHVGNSFTGLCRYACIPGLVTVILALAGNYGLAWALLHGTMLTLISIKTLGLRGNLVRVKYGKHSP